MPKMKGPLWKLFGHFIYPGRNLYRIDIDDEKRKHKKNGVVYFTQTQGFDDSASPKIYMVLWEDGEITEEIIRGNDKRIHLRRSFNPTFTLPFVLLLQENDWYEPSHEDIQRFSEEQRNRWKEVQQTWNKQDKFEAPAEDVTKVMALFNEPSRPAVNDQNVSLSPSNPSVDSTGSEDNGIDQIQKDGVVEGDDMESEDEENSQSDNDIINVDKNGGKPSSSLPFPPEICNGSISQVKVEPRNTEVSFASIPTTIPLTDVDNIVSGSADTPIAKASEKDKSSAAAKSKSGLNNANSHFLDLNDKSKSMPIRMTRSSQGSGGGGGDASLIPIASASAITVPSLSSSSKRRSTSSLVLPSKEKSAKNDTNKEKRETQDEHEKKKQVEEEKKYRNNSKKNKKESDNGSTSDINDEDEEGDGEDDDEDDDDFDPNFDGWNPSEPGCLSSDWGRQYRYYVSLLDPIVTTRAKERGWRVATRYPSHLLRREGDVDVAKGLLDPVDEEYVVEYVMDQVYDKKKYWYLLKYKGYECNPAFDPYGRHGDWVPESFLKNNPARHRWRLRKPDWWLEQLDQRKFGVHKGMTNRYLETCTERWIRFLKKKEEAERREKGKHQGEEVEEGRKEGKKRRERGVKEDGENGRAAGEERERKRRKTEEDPKSQAKTASREKGRGRHEMAEGRTKVEREIRGEAKKEGEETRKEKERQKQKELQKQKEKEKEKEKRKRKEREKEKKKERERERERERGKEKKEKERDEKKKKAKGKDQDSIECSRRDKIKQKNKHEKEKRSSSILIKEEPV